MLSYQHAYHAGNFADVLKHSIVVEILEHLLKKEKPFSYIETHAGSGLYDFQSPESRKKQEFNKGIARLTYEDWPELSRYIEIIKYCNQQRGCESLRYYPGSPMIALTMMRPSDRAWLYELHPQELARLTENIGNDRRVVIQREDGHNGILSLLPPQSRRGLVLIDPPYEVKTEYDQVVETIISAHRKFSTGVYALWYPVVDRDRVLRLEDKFIASGIRDILRLELGVAADTPGSGMTASGMIVINPPWQLHSKFSALLPKLAGALATTENETHFAVDSLVGE